MTTLKESFSEVPVIVVVAFANHKATRDRQKRHTSNHKTKNRPATRSTKKHKRQPYNANFPTIQSGGLPAGAGDEVCGGAPVFVAGEELLEHQGKALGESSLRQPPQRLQDAGDSVPEQKW